MTDLITLLPSTIIPLYEIDCNPCGVSLIIRMCDEVQGDGTPVLWGNASWQPWPVQGDGWEISGKGQLPSPQITVLGVTNKPTGSTHSLARLCRLYDDLVYAKVTRYRVKLSDLVFSNTNCYPVDRYRISRKIRQDGGAIASEGQIGGAIQWELKAAIDLPEVQLPLRKITQEEFPGVSAFRQRS